MRVHTANVSRATAAALVTALCAAALGTGVAAATTERTGPGDQPGSDAALTTPFALVDDRDVDDRLDQPEDRYALANGCYTIELSDGRYLGREADGGVPGDEASAVPLHFQPTELGRYLIVADEGASDDVEGAWWSDRSYLSGGALGALPFSAGNGTVFATAPSFDGDWQVVAAGDDPDARDATGQAYDLTLPDASPGVLDELAGVRFHLADGCAVWPEITTNTSGPPAPTNRAPNAPVQGFFEAHIHGMAYEFLGGELRCGQPWHRWGVEYALPNCYEDGNVHNGTLEVGLAGQPPTDPVAEYDPVGWPTFAYWPKHDTLTHEQYYWKWLERAYHGGLRLTTILLVENTALCQAFPLKKNSCNEMDSVRLQAQRMFELQEYIDAQNGGPGEGWLRIVTTPAQARAVINDGRLAIVLGIEVSELFDCREVLGVPQCTEESIDASLTEVMDMGVRQMQMINKFDNSLAGVTGDGGSTGVVVSQGQRSTSGHYWDMRTCPEEVDDTGGDPSHSHEGDQHDKTQLNFNDDVAQGEADEIDVLAGIILDQYGALDEVGINPGAPAPVYEAGPHCNTRGLTDLGRHLIERMVENGILFDPDHMSALAIRESLDHIEDVIIPAMHEEAGPGRPVRTPGVISSHSWGNDVAYQRIYDLDGHVSPRTTSADRFVGRWEQRRAWHEEHAPPGAFFGLGYGADTNGLGGQPGPRSQPVEFAIDYEAGWQAPIGGVTLFQQQSGVRSYDMAVDGAAHYGLIADWFQEIRLSAREQGVAVEQQITTDMLNGAEDFLRTWERAVYGGNDCVTDGSSLQVDDIHAALGLDLERFLTAVGQPLDRDGSAYFYCVEGEGGEVQAVQVAFTEDGTAASVAPSDRDLASLPGTGHHAGGVVDGALAATGGGVAMLAAVLLGGAGLFAGTARRTRRDA